MIYVNTICDTSSMDTMGQRLRFARETAGLRSARAAAARHNWKASTYAAHENGQNDFDYETAKIYARAFRTTAAWLQDGDGDPPSQPKAGGDRSGQRRPESSIDRELNLAAAPDTVLEIDVRAGAGGGGSPILNYVSDRAGNTYEAEGVRDEWSLPATVMQEMLHAAPKHIRAFEVIGDSMEPRLQEGDRVFVDLRYTVPSPEGIFALWDGLGIVVKRVQVVRGSEPMRLRIISVNEQYEPYEATVEEVRIIGRYAGRFTVN